MLPKTKWYTSCMTISMPNGDFVFQNGPENLTAQQNYDMGYEDALGNVLRYMSAAANQDIPCEEGWTTAINHIVATFGPGTP